MVWGDRGHRNYGLAFSATEQMTLSEDNTWGFGQNFPLVLLILPLVSFFEVVYGKPLLHILESFHNQYVMLISCYLKILSFRRPAHRLTPPQT